MKQREIPPHRDPEQRIYNRDTSASFDKSHDRSRRPVRARTLLSLLLHPFAESYYLEPVPWHVYLFAFHGTVMLIAFEEVKKYYRRKGYPLEFLG